MTGLIYVIFSLICRQFFFIRIKYTTQLRLIYCNEVRIASVYGTLNYNYYRVKKTYNMMMYKHIYRENASLGLSRPVLPVPSTGPGYSIDK